MIGVGMEGTTAAAGSFSDIYEKLLAHFGPQHWWPADTAAEMILGAILTQHTSWNNVEFALANLKNEGLIDFQKLFMCPPATLAQLIRPSGYFNQKAKTIQTFAGTLMRQHRGSLESLFRHSVKHIRKELLSITGIGPETADSIILYAAHKPIFVIDAYTKRILRRCGLSPSSGDHYEDWRLFIEAQFPPDVQKYQEAHALLVAEAKAFCGTHPDCDNCPLIDCPRLIATA